MKLRHCIGLRWLALAAILMTLTVSVARADVITFSGLSGPNGAAFTTYTEGTFTVSSVSGTWFQGTLYGNPVPSIFYGNVVNTGAEIQVTGTGDFTWSSVDYSSNNGASNFIIVGLLANATQFIETGIFANACTSGCAFSTLIGTDSSTVINALDIFVSPNGAPPTSINLDNINVTTVATTPEPASLTLLGSGLIGLAGAMRRRKGAFKR